MDIHVGSSGEIRLEKVFLGVMLKSEVGEEFGISMRDSGFEFIYFGEWYEAKEGIVKKMGEPSLESPSTGSIARG